MPQFHYIAKTRAGERREGTLEAPDRRTLLTLLSRQGLVPISVTDAATQALAVPEKKSRAARRAERKALTSSAGGIEKPRRKWFRLERRRQGRARMKLAELLLFTGELSDLLASGMTLGTALHSLALRKTGRAQDEIVTDLRDEIVQGSSLSTALARWPESFPTLYVSMVRAGEASGQLSAVLERLMKHYERLLEAREKVMMAMVYPIIVALIGFGAMIFIMTFVVPRFSAMFEELGGTLPLPTRMLIAISEGLLRYGWVLAIVLFFGIAALRRTFRTPAGREWKDRLLLRLPAVGAIVRANAFSNFAHTLGTLLANGVQVLPALSIVESTVGNSVIAKALREAKERVTDGSSISRPLAQDGVFPPLLTDMLAVGEESGDIAGALAHIGRRYDNELDRAVKLFTTILEPIMMLVIAAGVGFVAISMLMAVFDLTSGLNT
ncbi:MAG TPA: type II secretion system F family protein [Kiritimatiellia bacterium]|jgi:type II secretory pathway component PulF|nr:type II secretion system F family protein [Kiritimatiellia bacterium]